MSESKVVRIESKEAFRRNIIESDLKTMREQVEELRRLGADEDRVSNFISRLVLLFRKKYGGRFAKTLEDFLRSPSERTYVS